MWILGPELSAYAKAALNCKDISLAPKNAQKLKQMLTFKTSTTDKTNKPCRLIGASVRTLKII